MLKSAKVVGLNSDSDAALALIIHPVSQADSSVKQSFYAIISASLEDAFVKVRQTLSEIETSFLSLDIPLSEKLPQVLNVAQDLLKDAENLQILLVAVDEDERGTVLYLLSHSSNLTPDPVLASPLQALLLRGDKKTNLCDMSSYELVSGILQEGDRVLLTTQNLIDLFDKKLDQFSLLPIEALEDEVANRLPQAQVYPLAAIIIENEKKVEALQGVVPSVHEADVLTGGRSRVNYTNLIKLIPRSKRAMIITGVILLVIVLAGAGLSFKNKKDSETTSRFNQSLHQAQEEFGRAQSLKDTDPQGSSESLSAAKKFVTEALKIKPQDGVALNLQKEINEASPDILKTISVSDFPVWLDLDLIKKDLSSKHLSLSVGKLLVFDENKKIPVLINLGSKASRILAGEDKIGDGKLASLNGNVALIFSSDKGVVKIDGDQVSVGVKPDKDWGNIADLYGFGGNLYLLDESKSATSSGQIWKYVPTASGYADKKEYLASGTKASLSGSVRMQIDSSVWVLKDSGEILKYTKGESDYFSYSGLEKGVKDPKSFFVADTTDNLYLLDSGNSRLLVLDKKGMYKAQYQSDKFQNFIDLVVDEGNKKVYLLDGRKIYQMELK